MHNFEERTGDPEEFPQLLELPEKVDDNRPVLAVTMGDPAGIGPELCLRLTSRALSEELPYKVCVIADVDHLIRVATAMDLPFGGVVYPIEEYEAEVAESGPVRNQRVFYLDVGFLRGKSVEPGKVQAQCGKAAGEYIRCAVAGTLQGWFDGVLTAPINKESLHLGGFDYPGHTEMLADLCGVPGEAALLLTSEQISVGFATLHTSLAEACRTLNADEIVRVGRLMDQTLRRRYGRPVRIGVLALNPHAGENGLFGREEIEIIRPAIERLDREGVMVDGPLVPDATFIPGLLHRFDGYLCMVHDQGAIPFKMVAFEDGVNLTMGLPIVRTSPDHGTAFDIAWKGVASPSSFFAAADLAGRFMGDDGK